MLKQRHHIKKIIYMQFFFRKMLGFRYGSVGTRKFSDYHIIILIAVSVQIFPLIIFSYSMDPTCNSRGPNRVLKHLNKPDICVYTNSMIQNQVYYVRD